MRRAPWKLFIFILFLTFCAVSFYLPKELSLKSVTLKIPFVKNAITTPKTIVGPNLGAILQQLGAKRDFELKRGLDLQGGTSITLQANMKGISADKQSDALESARTVIEKRVNYFGVSEPVVQTAKTGTNARIIVELPGITDVNQAAQLIGSTAKLTFWEQGASGSAQLASSSALPLGITYFMQNPQQTNLTGSDLQRASVVFDPNTGKPQVQLQFSSTGAKKFSDITTRNVGKPLAMVLDNQLIDQPPTVQVPITNGIAVISSSAFTTDQAKQLAVQLNAGALPISLTVLEQHAIGATLGQASLQKSLYAGLLGFLVVVTFMCVLYGRLGVVASLALSIYTLLTLALFRLIPVTMTLAGIAGLILSIGIAVDANILIFERMREELRKGKPQNVALEQGFTRAWASIRDSNFASLITSSILYYFGTGIVRGFALTLALGVLVSMFSAIVVTRTFLRIVYRK